jgi:hypothetical protein
MTQPIARTREPVSQEFERHHGGGCIPRRSRAAGGSWLIGLWPVCSLVSALLSAYLMAPTSVPRRPLDFNADEPDAYARNITRNEKVR